MSFSARVPIFTFLALTPVLAAQTPTPRSPLGIYAIVNVEDNINTQTKANPSITTAQLDASFDALYQGLLGKPGNFGAHASGALGHR